MKKKSRKIFTIYQKAYIFQDIDKIIVYSDYGIC